MKNIYSMNIRSTIKLKSFNVYKLNKIILELKKNAETNTLNQKIITLPNKKKKFTILKSPHVHKKARDQFELESFTKIMQIEGTAKNTKEFLKILETDFVNDITYLINFKKIK
jgi:small subunit ribosomal protein S10